MTAIFPICWGSPSPSELLGEDSDVNVFPIYFITKASPNVAPSPVPVTRSGWE